MNRCNVRCGKMARCTHSLFLDYLFFFFNSFSQSLASFSQSASTSWLYLSPLAFNLFLIVPFLPPLMPICFMVSQFRPCWQSSRYFSLFIFFSFCSSNSFMFYLFQIIWVFTIYLKLPRTLVQCVVKDKLPDCSQISHTYMCKLFDYIRIKYVIENISRS